MRLLSTAGNVPLFKMFTTDSSGGAIADTIDEGVPEYAILSHTWLSNDEEVKLADFNDLKKAKQKSGWTKIDQARRKAQENGFAWIWIDTCCIDQTSSAELSESINAMYRWYRDSRICYVYLADMDSKQFLQRTGSAHQLECLEKCRWFTRGWTLQEMIAPRTLHFFGNDWTFIGDRIGLGPHLETITRVPITKFNWFKKATAAEKMSWAASRTTSRGEDRAYSLLGMFEVNLPLLYGEGAVKAFQRLQEEILRRTRDLSLLLWRRNSKDDTNGVLARSPNRFKGADNIVPCAVYVEDLRDPLEVISTPFPQLRLALPVVGQTAVFNFRLKNDHSGPIGLRISSHNPLSADREGKEVVARFIHSEHHHVVPAIKLQGAIKQRLLVMDHFNWAALDKRVGDLSIRIRASSNVIEDCSSTLRPLLTDSETISLEKNGKFWGWQIDVTKLRGSLTFAYFLFAVQFEFSYITAPGLCPQLYCFLRQLIRMPYEESEGLDLFRDEGGSTPQWHWASSGSDFVLQTLSHQSSNTTETVKVSCSMHGYGSSKICEFEIEHSMGDIGPELTIWDLELATESQIV